MSYRAALHRARRRPWCFTTSAHRLNARGAVATGFLKRCKSNAHNLAKHFAFGKRVWTRYAPTARAGAAICVQRFDDSLNPAIHITYRVSRRSSSLREPRDPSLKGGCWFLFVCSKPFGGCGLEKVVCEINHAWQVYTVCIFCVVNVIDPSAGSPTETLLRLLLPRNVQI